MPSQVLDSFPEMAKSPNEPPGNRANISVREAAAILGVSPQRVGFYIRRGDLPASTINGVDYVLQRSDVLKYDAERRAGERRTGPGRPPTAQQREAEARREREAARAAKLRAQMTRPSRAPRPPKEPPAPDA